MSSCDRFPLKPTGQNQQYLKQLEGQLILQAGQKLMILDLHLWTLRGLHVRQNIAPFRVADFRPDEWRRGIRANERLRTRPEVMGEAGVMCEAGP